MRLIYLSSSKIPSMEANSIQVMRMAEAFSENGIDVTLFASRGNIVSESGDLYSDYGVKRLFPLRFCGRPNLAQLGSLIYGAAVGLACRNINADIFYGRCPHSLYFASFLKKPFVYEAHDFPRRRLRRWLESKLFLRPNFRRLVVISKALRKDYLRAFQSLNEDKVRVAHDGACLPSDSLFSDYTKARKSGGRLSVGYVGSLYSGKGVEGVIELAYKRAQYQYHVVGGGGADVVSRAKFAPENVRFHGRVLPSLALGMMREFDILLLPAKTKIEASRGGNIAAYTSPLKMFEYMAAGRPIIASRLPVLEEVLVDGYNALLANPNSISEWCDALDRLSRDPALRSYLAYNALMDLKSKYSWSIRALSVLQGLSW